MLELGDNLGHCAHQLLASCRTMYKCIEDDLMDLVSIGLPAECATGSEGSWRVSSD